MAGLFALPLDASPQSSGKGSWKLPPRMMSNWEIAADYEVMSLIMTWVVAGNLLGGDQLLRRTLSATYLLPILVCPERLQSEEE